MPRQADTMLRVTAQVGRYLGRYQELTVLCRITIQDQDYRVSRIDTRDERAVQPSHPRRVCPIEPVPASWTDS